MSNDLRLDGRVIQNWNPEKAENWDSKTAWKTLGVSTFALTIGFCTWYIVSAIALVLNDIGFELSKSQLYWLTAIPGLACGLFRLVFMFLPPVMGTRKLVTMSSLLFLIPMFGVILRGPGHLDAVLVAAHTRLPRRHRRRSLLRVHALYRVLLP